MNTFFFAFLFASRFASRILSSLLIGLGLAALTACLPLSTAPPPYPTSTTTATALPTATIQWFPPTVTPTPLQAVRTALTPTQDLSPAHGVLIFQDDFTNPEDWALGRTADGSMALGANELTLAVSRPKGQLFSMRQATILADFYLEVTAAPSICRGADEYGVMLHVTPPLEFFRFALTCDGRARVDRYYQGKASSPQPLAYFGAVPPGGPSRSRLGIHVSGREMRFYANGIYLFSVNDPSIPSGGLAMYARSAGDEMLTVNFSELVVYEVDGN